MAVIADGTIARPRPTASTELDIGTLEAVADHASVRQIIRRGLATVLPARDVVDLVREGRVVLMNAGNTRSESRRAGATAARSCRRDSQPRFARISRAFALAIAEDVLKLQEMRKLGGFVQRSAATLVRARSVRLRAARATGRGGNLRHLAASMPPATKSTSSK